MRTLFLLANVMLVLFLAAPNKIEAQEPQEDQMPNIVSRLEARVAELEKRLALVEARLTKIAGTTSGAARSQRGPLSRTSRDDGARFIGNWKSIRSGDYVSISKDGDKYIVNNFPGGIVVCELSGGSLKSGGLLGNIDFMESSGHIFWRGMELAKLPQTSR